jgi:hypothetical protein
MIFENYYFVVSRGTRLPPARGHRLFYFSLLFAVSGLRPAASGGLLSFALMQKKVTKEKKKFFS